jgi:hypothetical protein
MMGELEPERREWHMVVPLDMLDYEENQSRWKR